MRIRMASVLGFLAVCFFSMGAGNVAYAQVDTQCGRFVRDADCFFSENPVPGVRIIRLNDYARRPAYYLFNDTYTILAHARETANRFSAFDFQVPPGGGPVPHTHGQEWEIFFVDQGMVSFEKLNPATNQIELQDAGPGTVVFGPQCPVHGFVNRTNAPARVFSFTLPAGLDVFFEVTGKLVVNPKEAAPPVTEQDILNLAFWGEVFGGGAFDEHAPPPFCPDAPAAVRTTISDPARPKEVGPFGETRVVLLTPAEVGNKTGATAFCGPGAPGRPGGSVKYTYFSLPNQNDFPASHVSTNTEVFYTLGGTLDVQFGNDQRKRVHLDPLTFISIDPGVTYSIANLAQGSPRGVAAQSLAITIVPPACQ